MKGYPQIGSVYRSRKPGGTEWLFWTVIENNSNDETSVLQVISACPENGTTLKANVKSLREREPVGVVLQPNGEIVIENGREFVRTVEEKGNSRVLKPENI